MGLGTGVSRTWCLQQNVARDAAVGTEALTIMSDTSLASTLQTLEDEHKTDDEEMVRWPWVAVI